MLREMKYYAGVGIIDFFELTMDKTELAIRLSKIGESGAPVFDNEGNLVEESYSVAKMKKIEGVEEEIREIIYKVAKEYPHTIRFFPVPNPDYNAFDVCVVAKIDNNGSTYIFAPDKNYLESINDETNSIKAI